MSSRYRTFTDAATLRVKCPTCGADPGERCRTGRGLTYAADRSHIMRERALRAERRKLLELRRAEQGELTLEPPGPRGGT